jgi:branched-chain amino acid transport system permease protein
MRGLASRPNTMIVLGLAIATVALAARDPVWTDTWVIVGVYVLIALSTGISYGQAGILSMSQGAFAAIGGYAAAVSTLRFKFPPGVDLLIAAVLPALLAYGLARLVTRLTPLATALATLALGSVIEIALRNMDDITGGYIGLAGIPGIGMIDSPLKYCVLVWAMICVCVLMYENLVNSPFGRALNVIRHDRMRAQADGVNVPQLLSAAFAFSAAMAGSAGWLYAHYISYISPNSLDTHTSISALLMTVVGGSGIILGPLAGTVFLDVLVRHLPAQELQGMFYGGALILILILAPTGLLGLVPALLARLRANRGLRGTTKATAAKPEAAR